LDEEEEEEEEVEEEEAEEEEAEEEQLDDAFGLDANVEADDRDELLPQRRHALPDDEFGAAKVIAAIG
jgi:hypothetical protein